MPEVTLRFKVAARDEGREPVDRHQGGLSEIRIGNFKGIRQITIKLDPMTLLVGANNSGKSTVLQAIKLFYYCIEKCGVRTANRQVIIKKQVMPFSSFGLIPAHSIKELVTNGVTPSNKINGIQLWGRLNSGQVFDFIIYSAYSTLLVILPGADSPKKMSTTEFDFASRQPLYVPGFFGVVTKELLSTNRAIISLTHQ